MIALTDRERTVVIVFATALMLVDVIAFPSMARSGVVLAADPIVPLPIVTAPPLVVPTAGPRGVDFEHIALGGNPYRADLEPTTVAPALPGGNTGAATQPFADVRVSGDRARMGDLATADDVRGDAPTAWSGAPNATGVIVVLGHGDGHALVQSGLETELVTVGSIVGGKRIVSITVAGGVRLADGSVLPSAVALPSPPAPSSAPNVPGATPTPAPSATPAPPRPYPPVSPGPANLSPALSRYLLQHRLLPGAPAVPQPQSSGGP